MKHIETVSTKCSGCTACSSICPKHAIRMIDDEEGFKVPIVDNALCVDCGICLKVCPAERKISQPTNELGNKAYAFQNPDNEIRYKSASGAFFPALAKYIIEYCKGYVCGCVLDDNLMPCHIVSDKWSDIYRMQDSKYVQSDMRGCFTEIVELLKAGKHVLFTGTSCQCKGLVNLLESKRVTAKTLITVDFFCHGVPSPLIWKEYLRYYERCTKRKPVGYKFRCKEFGWGAASRYSYHLNTMIYSSNSRVRREHCSVLSRYWRTIFFSNISIRRYCHSCPYTTVDKPSDITMADFWGIEQYKPELSDGKGCSLLISHNQKGDQIIKSLEGYEVTEVEVSAAVKRQENAFHSCPEHPHRKNFWNDYHRHGFEFVIKKYLNYNMTNRLKSQIKYLLFITGLRHY